MSNDTGVGSDGYNIWLTLELAKGLGHIAQDEDADTAWPTAADFLDSFEASEFNNLDADFQTAMRQYLETIPTSSEVGSAETLFSNLEKSHSKNVLRALKVIINKSKLY